MAGSRSGCPKLGFIKADCKPFTSLHHKRTVECSGNIQGYRVHPACIGDFHALRQVRRGQHRVDTRTHGLNEAQLGHLCPIVTRRAKGEQHLDIRGSGGEFFRRHQGNDLDIRVMARQVF